MGFGWLTKPGKILVSEATKQRLLTQLLYYKVFVFAADDHQALIWDIQQMPRAIEDPILAYTAGGEINQNTVVVHAAGLDSYLLQQLPGNSASVKR